MAGTTRCSREKIVFILLWAYYCHFCAQHVVFAEKDDVCEQGKISGFISACAPARQLADHLHSDEWKQVKDAGGMSRSRFGKGRQSLESRPESRLQPGLQPREKFTVAENVKESAPKQFHSEDQEALLAFKAGIIDDPFGALSSWNERDSTPCVNWTGVLCNSTTGRVQILNLVFQSLNGTIAQEVGSLSMLNVLDLSYNSLTGEIPHNLSRLGNLVTLRLGNNWLTGNIPPSLGRLGSLVTLELNLNFLIGEIPPSLSRLGSLVTLDLSYNYLTGEIPHNLSRLDNLVTLSLHSNFLTGKIPSSLERLGILETLDFGENSLTGKIPSQLGGLSHLRTLDLSGNANSARLSGSVFSFLANMSNLTYIDLSYNGFTGNVLTSLVNCSYLVDIRLSRNNFSGSIPPELGALTGMNNLNLSQNMLTGGIPPEFGNFSDLQTLDLSDNFLSGSIPVQLTNALALSTIHVENNNLSGQIPQGPQFRTQNISSYSGNPGLCGFPLPPCTLPHNSPSRGFQNQEPDFFMSLPGFGVGVFIGFLSTVVLIVTWQPAWKFVRHPWRERSSYHRQYGLYSSPA